jgi:hypothetical protein
VTDQVSPCHDAASRRVGDRAPLDSTGLAEIPELKTKVGTSLDTSFKSASPGLVLAVLGVIAYIQKNPALMAQNPAFRAEVLQAYQYSVDQVRLTFAAGLRAQRDAPGSTPSGVGTAPPPLRIP